MNLPDTGKSVRNPDIFAGLGLGLAAGFVGIALMVVMLLVGRDLGRCTMQMPL